MSDNSLLVSLGRIHSLGVVFSNSVGASDFVVHVSGTYHLSSLSSASFRRNLSCKYKEAVLVECVSLILFTL